MRITLKLSAAETHTVYSTYVTTEDRAEYFKGYCISLMAVNKAIESVLVVDCKDQSICLWN